MPPDPHSAAAFIRALTGSGQTPCTWQLFSDDPQRKTPDRARVLHGPLSRVVEHLTTANADRCGVFVTVNETDLRGRRATNVRSVRALFIDTDGFIPQSWHLEPSIVVRSNNGIHAYWLVDDCSLDDFRDAQKRLIAWYGSDQAIHDLPRVMRVPGYLHGKGVPFMVEMLQSTQRRHTLAQVMTGLPALPRPAPRRKPERSMGPVNWSAVDPAAMFRDAGMYRRDLGGGKHAVICPWEGDHTHPDFKGQGTSTVVWDGPPSTFHCSHAHCDGRDLATALAMLGYDLPRKSITAVRAESAAELYARTLREMGVSP